MIVYVIEKGFYSDRHVVGVTTSEEQAKYLCEVYRRNWGDSDTQYTAYDTDHFSDRRIRFICTYYGEGYYNKDEGWEIEVDDYDFHDGFKETGWAYGDVYVVYADSVQRAKKIAQDLRAQVLAEKAGIT